MAIMQNDSIMIRDLPLEERPREKLKSLGAGALTNAELLAILIRMGNKNESAVQLATRILARGGSLRNLPDLSLEDLQENRGIGPDKAYLIHWYNLTHTAKKIRLDQILQAV